MDLKEFINLHIEKQTIGNIVEGVSQSTFADTNVNIQELVKLMLAKLLVGTGDKKQSYCTDFNTILNNLLALLGYEFSKYLMFISTMKYHIGKIVLLLKDTSSYEEILYFVTCIENMYHFLTIDDKFDYKKYILMNDKIHTGEMVIHSTKIKDLFAQLHNQLDIVIKSGSIINFEKDKGNWIEMFNDMLSCTNFQNYTINTIDELCINLGNFDVGYNGSFLKLFDILYRENYADVPREYVEPKIFTRVLPHIDYLKELELGSCENYITALHQYYKKMYYETYKSLSSVESTIEVFKVEVTDDMYDYLSHVSLNLFIQISKHIANNQIIQTIFSKSTRIQFVQILTAIHACLPKLSEFTESQKNTLHYFLLNKKILQETYYSIINAK